MLSRVLMFSLLLGGGAVWAQRTTQLITPDLRTETVEATAKPTSRVAWIERPSAVLKFSVDHHMVRAMFNQALLACTKQASPAAAWKSLGLTPQDVVGIKINTTGGPLLSSHPALVEAIVDSVQAAGVPARHIIIWDKLDYEMESAGYALTEGDGTTVRVRCVVPQTSYDPGRFYLNEIMGRLIWGDMQFIGQRPTKEDLLRAAEQSIAKKLAKDHPTDLPETESAKIVEQNSNKSYYAKLVTQVCTKIINVPVLMDHKAFGLNGCLSSLAMASVDNTRRFQGEETSGDPAIPEILEKDFIRKKIILHVMDALVAEYAGGPNFNPQFTQVVGALYVSPDPVAIDSLVLPRIEAWRAEGRVPRIGEAARHIKSATEYSLGESNPKKIELIQLR